MKEKRMKRNIKKLLLSCLLITILLFVAGCAQEENPYVTNDDLNYTVSVRYDANGGLFTTNTSVIVDSYDLSAVPNGELALIAPNHEARGNDAFEPVCTGYFLAGWYSQRIEHTDSAGNITYTYSGLWDFENDRLTLDPTREYTAQEPVLTLYAAWIPVFEINFYSLGTGEYLSSYTYNPTSDTEVLVPQWDEETGTINMYRFPTLTGCTFNGAYYDAEGTKPVDTAAVAHTGTVDYAIGTASDTVMDIYIDWMEGNWYHIYTARQFVDNANVAGSYIIHADLDFSEELWPTALMHGSFSGTIEGNGHTFSNIQVTQTNNSKTNAGLFGSLTETAVISDLTLENVTFTIEGGTRVAGTSFGLFAGTVSESATVSNLSIVNGLLQIDSGCYFGTDDYVIGLVAGMGAPESVDASGITCVAVGTDPERLVITVDDDVVTVEFVSE